jgi:hypothetical protein
MKYYFHPALSSFTAYTLIHPLFRLPTLEGPFPRLSAPFTRLLTFSDSLPRLHLSTTELSCSCFLFTFSPLVEVEEVILTLIFYHIYVTLGSFLFIHESRYECCSP